MFVGNIDNRKAEYLVPFIELLNEKNSEVHTYIMGATIHKKIVKKIKNLSNTHYLGIIKDVMPYYYEADVLTFISKIEACPLVPIEAQACGLPVVAWDVCSNKEIIVDEKSGFLVEFGNINDFVNKILEILENSRLREKMSKDCIENAKKLQWDAKAQEYINLFEKLSDKS